MSVSRRFSLILGAIAIVIVGIVVVALSLPSGDDEPEDVTVAPTPTLEPTTTAAPSAFAGFALKPGDGVVQPVATVDAIPVDRIGAYFLDVAAGTVTGWYAATVGAEVYGISGDNRFVSFRWRAPSSSFRARLQRAPAPYSARGCASPKGGYSCS